MFLIMLSNIAQSKNYLVEVDDEKEGGSNEDSPASVDQEEVNNDDNEELKEDIESEGNLVIQMLSLWVKILSL